MKKKGLYRVTIPSLIRETLGDETADMMQKAIDESDQAERQLVIYTTYEGVQAINDAINEAIQNEILKGDNQFN